MFVTPSFRRQGLSLALCCLMLGHDLAAGASLRARSVHGHNHGHHASSHAVASVEMSIKDRRVLKEAILYLKPMKHLKNKLMKRMQDMNIQDVVAKLGQKLPMSVVAMVKAESTHKTEAPEFTEASLGKARKILNAMVEEAQVRLDEKVIECKVFWDRNRGAEQQISTDLSRLAEQISDLIRLIGESITGIQETSESIKMLEEHRAAKTKEYNEILWADEAEMVLRRDDLAVAEFILSFTVCEDKKKAASLFQARTGVVPKSNLNVKFCAVGSEGNLEFHFEDPKLEADAEKFLTPGARQKLQKYLSDVDTAPVNKLGLPKKMGLVQTVSGEDQEPEKEGPPEVVKEEAPLPPSDMAPLMTGGTSPEKCSLGKPNCGLLHDNMSIMWGKFKDFVDELQDKMDKDAEVFKELEEDLNRQMAVLTTMKATFAAQQAEATANKNADEEEQAGKNEEHYLIEAEFKEVWGECEATIYEITFTDICGVLTVRGEVAKFSKDVPPNAITDCELSEFIPTMCEGPNGGKCDDECDPHGSTPNCGGMQYLNREIIQPANEFGTKCAIPGTLVPQLQHTRPCGQILCPVNCGMSSWSGFTKCTKECEGGVQVQTRNIVVKPKNGGDSCDTTSESRPCNTGSCDRDCDLEPFTPWTPCTQACGSGMEERYRHIERKLRGNGKCPSEDSSYRFEERKCNVHACVGDEVCIAEMDFIMMIDGSGSLRESGFKVLRDFTAQLVRRFSGEKYGFEASKVGVVQFGNGAIMKDGTISSGLEISELSGDIEKVATKIDETIWQKGFTNLAQAFPTADKISMNSGRKEKPSTFLVITDGKPSFKFSTWQMVKAARDKGVNVIIVEVNENLGEEDKEFMQDLASEPWETNYVAIPGVKKLKREMDKWVTETLVQSCPRAESPSQTEVVAESKGYELYMEGWWCGEQTKEMDVHIPIGSAPNEGACFMMALEYEAQYFSYGTEEGFNKGECYFETQKIDEKEKDEDQQCGAEGGWAEAPVRFNKILPMEGPGKGEEGGKAE